MTGTNLVISEVSTVTTGVTAAYGAAGYADGAQGAEGAPPTGNYPTGEQADSGFASYSGDCPTIIYAEYEP